MELDTIHWLIAMRENEPTVKPYMEYLRDKIIEIAEDVADLAEERNEEIERAANAANAEELEFEDADDEEYNAEAPDHGGDALIELLAAAAMIAEDDDEL